MQIFEIKMENFYNYTINLEIESICHQMESFPISKGVMCSRMPMVSVYQ